MPIGIVFGDDNSVSDDLAGDEDILLDELRAI